MADDREKPESEQVEANKVNDNQEVVIGETNQAVTETGTIEIETHHSEEEVVERLFQKPDVSEQISSIWGWASGVAQKMEKQLGETVEKVKSSDLRARIDEVTSHLKESDPFKEASTFVNNLQTQYGTEFDQKETNSNTSAMKLPWETGSMFSSEIKERILGLSAENSSFLVPPPDEVNFIFDEAKRKEMSPLSEALLKVDEELKKKKKDLVPRKIDENSFWKNYLYRVELITDSYASSAAPIISTETASKEVEAEEEEADGSQTEKNEKDWEKELTSDVDFDDNNTEDFEMFDDDELLEGIDDDIESDDEVEKRLKEKLNSK